MKVASVYTSTTPELIGLVEKEVGDVPPWETEMANYQDPSILIEVRDVGHAAAPLIAKLVGMCMAVVSEGTDIILNLRFSVGEVAGAVQDIARYTGIPITRVDGETCREAVGRGKRIEVMATLLIILNLTKSTILRVAREMSRQVELMDVLVDGGFGLGRKQSEVLTNGYAGTIAGKVDVILFAQGSMVYYEGYTHEGYGKVVLFGPRLGAAALEDALAKKGLI